MSQSRTPVPPSTAGISFNSQTHSTCSLLARGKLALLCAAKSLSIKCMVLSSEFWASSLHSCLLRGSLPCLQQVFQQPQGPVSGSCCTLLWVHLYGSWPGEHRQTETWGEQGLTYLTCYLLSKIQSCTACLSLPEINCLTYFVQCYSCLQQDGNFSLLTLQLPVVAGGRSSMIIYILLTKTMAF